jgi:iron complex transport system substrate-binding protein
VRVISLLPSATEIAFALDLADDVVGVTHECDWPPKARKKQRVSFTTLPEGLAPAEIDRAVSESIGRGEPIYRLDKEAIRELHPDLVLTQDLCAVCAVPTGDVAAALDELGCRAEVVSLDPHSLNDLFECIVRVGEATGTRSRALSLVEEMQRRLDAVAASVAGQTLPSTLALEWSDPPFNGGHWVPEMIRIAGGEPVLAADGAPSARLAWDEIAAAAPEVVAFMPCGYGLDAAAVEASYLTKRDELASVRQIFALDASAYFSRPGPRLVDGVEILAWALHPESVRPPPRGAMAQVR